MSIADQRIDRRESLCFFTTSREAITIEEASTQGHIPMRPPGPYADVLSAIEKLSARRCIPSLEPGKIIESEQEIWDLFELEGTLDPARLLQECQVRAQGGEDDAQHKFRHKSRASRLGRPFSWPTLPRVAPDPRDRTTLGPHLWALLIGNDAYPQSPLRGAVNDSEAWNSYLIDCLGVPKSHITRIQNADRNTMVTALYDLRDNGEIKEGDHILFAYSGHGTSYDAKEHSFEDDISNRAGSIEALCPVDRGIPSPDISDREVLLILSEINNQTKANITVVLDCCHSGGGTRELGDDRRFRTMNPLGKADIIGDMFRYADEHPRRRSTISVCSPAWASNTVDIYRPVLLVACQDIELAREENGHGVFTSAVMQVLRSEMGRNMTCSGLIKAITPLRYDQNPRFDGEDATLFQIGNTR